MCIHYSLHALRVPTYACILHACSAIYYTARSAAQHVQHVLPPALRLHHHIITPMDPRSWDPGIRRSQIRRSGSHLWRVVSSSCRQWILVAKYIDGGPGGNACISPKIGGMGYPSCPLFRALRLPDPQIRRSTTSSPRVSLVSSGVHSLSAMHSIYYWWCIPYGYAGRNMHACTASEQWMHLLLQHVLSAPTPCLPALRLLTTSSLSPTPCSPALRVPAHCSHALHLLAGSAIYYTARSAAQHVLQ